MKTSLRSYSAANAQRFSYSIFLPLGLLIAVAVSANAQITNVDGPQASPIPGAGHDYIRGLQETVDPAYGSVSVRIDLGAPASRGFSVPVALLYSSSGIDKLQANYQGISNIWYSGLSVGWSYSLPTLHALLTQDQWNTLESGEDPSQIPYACTATKDYIFQDPSGARHMMPIAMAYTAALVGQQACSGDPYGSTVSVLSGGDDLYFATTVQKDVADAPVTITGNDGTVYNFGGYSDVSGTNPGTFPDSIEDRNGNVMNSIVDSIGERTGLKDTNGRTLVSFSLNGNPSSPANANQVTVSGIPKPFQLQWATANTNFSFGYQYFENYPNSQCRVGSSGTTGQVSIVQTLTLPNGQTYTFQYDPTYGLLNKITYPNGGYVQYVWGENPLSATSSGVGSFAGGAGGNTQTFTCTFQHGTPAVMHRYVSYDGVNVAEQQDYNYAPTVWSANGTATWTSKTTTVTTKDLIRKTQYDTVYNYAPVTVPNPPNSPALYPSQTAVESSIAYKDFSGTLLRTVNKGWIDQYLLGCETETLDDGEISGKWYQYDAHSQQTDQKEYDYGTLSTSCSSATATSPPSTTPTRETVTAYQAFGTTPIGGTIYNRPSSVKVYGSGTLAAETDYGYDQSSVTSGSSPTQHDSNFSTAYVDPRGDATTVTRKCIAGTGCASDSITTYTYDETGQLASMTDACGNGTCADMTGSNHKTTYSYVDSPSGANPAGNSNAYLTSVEGPSTNGVAHNTSYKYDYTSGDLVESDDENGLATTYSYADPFLRLTDIYGPTSQQNNNVQPHTHTDYSDGATSIATSTNPVGVVSETVSDGLGHVIGTQLKTDPQGTDLVDTTFDGEGLVYTETNPYRSGDATAKTTLTYDSLGRKSLQQNPDGTSEQWQYSGPTATFTDEAGSQWRRTYDALGRLVKVVEPGGGATTSYTYNALDDLTGVSQVGSGLTGSTVTLARQFAYDSLSRLITSTNPETGTTCYGQWSGTNCVGGYDANGNLVYKTDASGTIIQYSYDALNRATAKTSPQDFNTNYQFIYDQGANGIGRLYQESDPIWNGQTYSGTQFSYDAMGRVTGTNWFHYNAQAWQSGISAQYDLAGNLTQVTYPDNRVISQTWDGSGRLTNVFDGPQANPGVPYISGVQYTASGTMAGATFGNGVSESLSWNDRLQPCHEQASSPSLPTNTTGGNLLDRQLFYGQTTEPNCGDAVGNNGNVWKILEGPNHDTFQSFNYDALNRLTSAFSGNRPSSNSYSFVHDYDSFGNMIPVDQLHTPMNYGIDASTNRMTLNGDVNTGDLRYYPNGMLASVPDGLGGSHTFGYTVEGYLRSIDSYQTGSYLTDGLGERTLAVPPNQAWHEYVYLNGQPMADLDSNGNWTDYIYANRQKIAKTETQGWYVHMSSASCNGSWNLMAGANALFNGAHISWREKHDGPVSSYLEIQFADDTWAYPTGSQDTDGQWHNVNIDLSAYAGKSIWALWLHENPNGNTGPWDGYFADVSLQPGDGSLYQLYNGQNYVPNKNPNVVGCSSGQLVAENDANGAATHYYLADQVGTTQMELSAGGWPVWEGWFTPFGQEIINGGEQNVMGQVTADGTNNRYKFTGKERDTESGLDYFGARYNSSSMGRFMSPDYSMNSVILELPQSWNKYGYVLNRPLYASDPDGRCPWCVGAVVGGIIEGGVDIASQLAKTHGSFSKADGFSWGEVGASTAGGAVAGALAVATGGASLVSSGVLDSAIVGDLASGGVSNVLGGIVTRAFDPNKKSDDVLSFTEVSKDAIGGFVGGGIGHLAGDYIHLPDDPVSGGVVSAKRRLPARTPDGRFASYDKLLRRQITFSGVGSSSATHFTNWLLVLPDQPCFSTSTDDISNPNGQGSVERSGCQ